MLLQTNSYIVPPGKRAAHAKVLEEFRRTMARLGCDLFEVYEQAGPNWDESQREGRFVQIMRFRDRAHQAAVQAAERNDPDAQRRISEFCELINFPYQQENGLFAVGFYTEMLAPPAAPRAAAPAEAQGTAGEDEDEYLDQELDSIVSGFGDPRTLLDESNEPAAPESRQQQPLNAQTFPRLASRDDSAPPPDEELDKIFQENFVPAARAQRASDALDSELGRVLDDGLSEDDLDIALPAELLEDEAAEGDELHDAAAAPAPARSRPFRPSDGRPGKR